MYKTIRPGKVLYDTDGCVVQAHGGSILYHNGKFYFYGENKEGITGTATGERCKNWTNGVKVYSSDDLYNWKDEGIIAISSREGTVFYPENITDRPHILYNEKTGLFVMWAKCSKVPPDELKYCVYAVAVSEDITKPFRVVAELDKYHAGDFDLVKDGGKAYIIFENPHDSMFCVTLNDDYTDFTDEMSIHIPKPFPPFTREAPAFFKRGGRKFLLTSGTTGYFPNETVLYEITDFHGEWRELGKPCVNDVNKNSFACQFSSVFRHPFIKDLYIALGDRWLRDLPANMPDINAIYERMFDKTKEHLPDGFTTTALSDENTSEATYVWLPVRFSDDGTPYICWETEWRVNPTGESGEKD